MARTRTSTSGDQETIHVPTSGSIIRGRGRNELKVEVGVGVVLLYIQKAKCEQIARFLTGQYLLMQLLFIWMCMIVSKGIDQLRIHLILFPPQCFKIPWLI